MGINRLKTKAKDPTDCLFGVQLDGTPFNFPISAGPHWLVCGQSGSGKSVMLNGMLISMIYHSTPEELNIIWVDPKKVEATAYIGLPYCPLDPITEMDDAYACLLYYTELMDERYRRFAKTGVKNLPEFNDWVEQNPEKASALGYVKEPYIVFVIDEFADMKDTVGSDVELPIKRLGQKARAAGIHLVIATQRPSVDVISSIITANVPSRVGMRTTNAANSNIIIQQDGCEKLTIGQAYIKTNDGMTRVTGPYISNGEIDAIFRTLREKYERPEPADYKSYLVENGIMDWDTEDGNMDKPPMERKLKKKRSRGGFGF